MRIDDAQLPGLTSIGTFISNVERVLSPTQIRALVDQYLYELDGLSSRLLAGER